MSHGTARKSVMVSGESILRTRLVDVPESIVRESGRAIRFVENDDWPRISNWNHIIHLLGIQVVESTNDDVH